MTKHIVIVISIGVLMTGCLFLPFLPGRHDRLAVTLSFMTQVFSFAGLSLVPLGIIWLLLERTGRKTDMQLEKKTKRFAIATLLTLGLIAVVLFFTAFSQYQLSFSIIFLVFCVFLLTLIYLKIKTERISGNQLKRVPIYLITIPVVVALVRLLFISRGVEFSRDYAIRKSKPLISAIESHHLKYGSYPVSLQALHHDIYPGVIGIEQYYYELNGNAYNLYFKQFSDELDVEEIVMYNKLDEHAYAAHRMDILEYSGTDLALRRGDLRRYKLSTPHWIYIKFD